MIGSVSWDSGPAPEDTCDWWPSCSGDFYCSITKDLLNATGPTYLTMVVHSCQSCELNSATFYVKGIKPEWIDVGIETEGGGMSQDSCGNWVDTSGSCTCSTPSASDTAGTVVFQPKRMTPRELANGQVAAFREFYSWGSMWERLTLRPLQKWAWIINISINQGFRYYYRRQKKRMPDFQEAHLWAAEATKQ